MYEDKSKEITTFGIITRSVFTCFCIVSFVLSPFLVLILAIIGHFVYKQYYEFFFIAFLYMYLIGAYQLYSVAIGALLMALVWASIEVFKTRLIVFRS